MAIECVAAVINARKAPFSGGTLVVLLAMANYADPDGTNIFPSLARLARQCRMTERNVQNCIDRLLEHGVLVLVEHAASRRGVFNEYKIIMPMLRELEGCMICGGVDCQETGCPDQAKSFRVNRRNPQQDHPKNRSRSPEKSSITYRKTRHRPVIDLGVASPRAPERRGDPALWETITTKAEPDLALKLQTWGAAPMLEGDAVVVDFEKDWSERYVLPLRAGLQRALGRPIVFRYAGRVGQ